jgi:hypothetical protein
MQQYGVPFEPEGLSEYAPSDLQTPLPLPEFFCIDQWALPYSNH